MGFSHAYGALTDRIEAMQTLLRAADMDYTFFDTAEVYGTPENPHHNEELVGAALKGRTDVVIATKFGIYFDMTSRSVNKPLGPDSRPETIRKSVEDSLRRLQRDQIDLYYQHRADPDVPVEEVAGVMADLIKEGKITHWGLSEATEDTLRRAHAVCPVTAIQNRYSMMARWYEDLFPVLEELGVGFVAFSPLANGLLSGAYGKNSRFDAGTDYRSVMPQFTPEAMDRNRALLALLDRLAGCGGSPANDAPADTAPEEPQIEAPQEPAVPDGALVIKEQGMFSAGGTVIESDGTFDVSNYYMSREGSTSHVDHANVFYQIPAEDTGLPMVFLHGYGQSRMGWMTTPDGRPGWSDLFLKMGHSVFLIDQPRRGEAGQTSVAGTMTTTPSDQTWYTQFRIGTFLDGAFTRNEGSQFPEGDEALDQFLRQMTPDTGMDNAAGDQNIDNTVVAQAVAATIDEVYERTGKDSILVTHSQGGMPGWETARYTDHIAAIAAIEPGMAPQVDSEDYNALVEKQIPVTFYYGDYIGEEFTDVPAAGMWAMMSSSADAFTEGYTAAVAETIAGALNADTFEIVPEASYSSADLNWTDRNSRVSREHDDESLREMELTAATVENWADYGTVFLGYPIWWGIAAWPVDAFVKANDFSGKTVIPFATSSSSGLGQSAGLLEQEAKGGDWQEGQRFSGGVSAAAVSEWVSGLNI